MSSIIREAKSEWLKRFDGAVLTKPVEFGAHPVRHFFVRNFDIIGRNMYLVSVYGRILLDQNNAKASIKGIEEAEQLISERYDTVLKEIQQKTGVLEAMASDEGVDAKAEFNKREKGIARITVPVQRRLLDILAAADNYALLVATLWIEGVLDEKQKSKAMLELRTLLKQTSSTVRKMGRLILGKINEAKSSVESAGDGASEAVAEMSAEGDADDDDEAADAESVSVDEPTESLTGERAAA